MTTWSAAARTTDMLQSSYIPFPSPNPASSIEVERQRSPPNEISITTRQLPSHGFFLPPPPGLTLPAPSPSRALQERSINLPSLEAMGCKRRCINPENFVIARDTYHQGPAAPTTPVIETEILKKAIDAISESSLRDLIHTIATADASIANRVMELQRTIQESQETFSREHSETEQRVHAARHNAARNKVRPHQEWDESESTKETERISLTAARSERKRVKRERRSDRTAAPPQHPPSESIEFDWMSRSAWREQFCGASHSSIKQDPEAQERCASRALQLAT
jgi:hypothetical protein